jgi:predicted NBD/HSP70 family sugar kinase
MLYRALLLALATAHAWNDCAFPDAVGYFTVDEGIGISFAYGAGAMNGKLYTGGYMKGHLAMIGVTDGGEVAPEPAATLWGDVHSDVQVRMPHL